MALVGLRPLPSQAHRGRREYAVGESIAALHKWYAAGYRMRWTDVVVLPNS